MSFENYITVYTDASFCYKTKVAAGAMWAKFGPYDVITKSWVFKTEPKDITEAEMMCIANAVYTVSKKVDLTNKILVIVTDSQSSIDFFTKNASSKDKDRMRRIEEILNKVKEITDNRCTIRFKKVKAHSNTDGRRSYVNRLVDNAARKSMRSKRSEILNGEVL